MPGLGLTLQQPKRLAHRVGDRPIEVQDLSPGASGEYDPLHLASTASRCDISTELGERYGLAALDLSQPFRDRVQGLVVREDLCRLFKRVVLVDRNQDDRRPTASGHDDVLTQVSHPIDEVSELTA
jgi:hypothetical protein